jgi:hypothetical protein
LPPHDEHHRLAVALPRKSTREKPPSFLLLYIGALVGAGRFIKTRSESSRADLEVRIGS